MSILKRAIGVLLGVVLLLVGVGFVLPGQVHVERSAVINAPPEQVFAQISDFNSWETWSPWAKMDADASYELSGSGVGQRMVWSSDDPRTGSGSQEVTELDAPRHLGTHLEFDGQGIAEAEFELEPVGSATRVTWSLDTDVREGVPLLMQPFSSYLGLAMDGLIGQDYETGLANLKAVVEAA